MQLAASEQPILCALMAVVHPLPPCAIALQAVINEWTNFMRACEVMYIAFVSAGCSRGHVPSQLAWGQQACGHQVATAMMKHRSGTTRRRCILEASSSSRSLIMLLRNWLALQRACRGHQHMYACVLQPTPTHSTSTCAAHWPRGERGGLCCPGQLLLQALRQLRCLPGEGAAGISPVTGHSMASRACNWVHVGHSHAGEQGRARWMPADRGGSAAWAASMGVDTPSSA